MRLLKCTKENFEQLEKFSRMDGSAFKLSEFYDVFFNTLKRYSPFSGPHDLHTNEKQQVLTSVNK